MKESEKLITYSRKDVIDRLAETRDFENADMRKAKEKIARAPISEILN